MANPAFHDALQKVLSDFADLTVQDVKKELGIVDPVVKFKGRDVILTGIDDILDKVGEVPKGRFMKVVKEAFANKYPNQEKPRKEKGEIDSPTKPKTQYQLFLKKILPELKKENHDLAFGDIMKLAGKMWQEEKNKEVEEFIASEVGANEVGGESDASDASDEIMETVVHPLENPRSRK